jgi:hypothetical protein
MPPAEAIDGEVRDREAGRVELAQYRWGSRNTGGIGRSVALAMAMAGHGHQADVRSCSPSTRAASSQHHLRHLNPLQEGTDHERRQVNDTVGDLVFTTY